MTSAFLTRFLTGDLPAILIVSALLTWPVSWGLLGLYRRAVRRSMRRDGAARRMGVDSATGPAAAAATIAATPALESSPENAARLLNELLTLRWRAARVYLTAAIAYAFIIAVVMAWVADPDAPFRPVRLLLLTTNFAWPAVLALGIVAGSTRGQRVLIAGAYATLYAVLIALGVWRSPTTSVGQLLTLWALNNLPSTVLVLFCLSRPIRAVGPLILLVLTISLCGADLCIALVGSRDSFIRAAVQVGDLLGLEGAGTLLAVGATGFLVLAIVGTALLFWIARQYGRKQVSDESLTIHTLWWLFVFGHAVGLAFENVAAPLIGVAAMIVFTLVSRRGLARSSRGAGPRHRLLLLRSFSIGGRAERFFDAFQKHWRRTGSIEMIAGFDLASRTIEPHEFLDFITGTVSRRFIDGRAALDQRLREMDTRPDRDGRFRVNEFFCYNDTWREVLLALVHHADAVLMDLRGFTRQNAGCVFEIGELFRLVPLGRIVFLVDDGTDLPFLHETFAAAGEQFDITVSEQPCVLSCPTLDSRTLRTVLAAVANAVYSSTRHAATTSR